MATVSERLQFLISANADQAIRAFEKTANSAEKEMTKSTKSIDKLGRSLTQFGARGLASAGVLSAGLFQMSQSAIDDQKAQALLATQLRKTTKATDEQIATVEEYIDVTARAVGVADDELRPAFAQLVRSTGSMTKAQNLLNLALDISAGTGKDLQSVTMALSKASTGQIGALTRLGIPMDENIKKSKDFNAALDILNKQFSGQAAVAADTYAGRLARAKVALDETKEEIGAGFIPVVQAGATAMANAAGTFTKLNDATGGGAAKLASYGTVALGAVSVISLVTGQVIKMREAFTTAEGKTTALGKSMKIAGGAIATLAIADATFTAINNANGAFEKMDSTLNDLLATFAKVGGGDATPVGAATKAFSEMARAQDKALQFRHIWDDWGKKVVIAGNEGKRSIEDTDAAFKSLVSKGGSVAAQRLVDDMRALAATMDKKGQGYKDLIYLADRYQKRLDNVAAGTKGLAAANADAAASEEEAAEALRKKEEAQKKAEEAAKKYTERLKELRKAISGDFVSATKSANEALATATKAFDTYRDSVAASVRQVYTFSGALDAMKTSTDRVTATQDAVTSATNAVTQAQRKQRDATWEVTDAEAKLAAARASGDAEDITEAERRLVRAREDATDAQSDLLRANTTLSKATTDASSATVEAGKTFIDRLTEQATTASQFGEKIQKLIAMDISQDSLQLVLDAGATAGGLIADELIAGGQAAVDQADALTESVKAAAGRAGTDAATEYYNQGVVLATNLVNGIDSVVKNYKLKLSSKGLTDKQLKRLQKRFAVDIGFQFQTSGMEIPELAEGGIVPATRGGRIVRVAEAGQAEAIIPLSRIGNNGGGGNVYHIQINSKIADATLPDLLVAELRKFNRRSGAIDIQVA
jgi:hypothetical protein